MADLDADDRSRLRKTQFAYVDTSGEGHLPIPDEAHIRNAMARFNQTDFDSAADKEKARRKILAAAKKHGIEVNADDHVAKPARMRKAAAPTTKTRTKTKSD